MIAMNRELHRDGIRETPVLLGGPGEAIFACLHRPRSTPAGLAVICSSIGAEFKYNYRREVLLARLLCARGMAAVRFHYLGAGNSDDGTLSFDRMVRDTHQVRQWACDVSGVDRPLFFGAKFGALVAAAAGRDIGSPIAAWAAPLTGAAYFRDVFRAGQAGRLAHPELGSGGPDRSARTLLESGEMADVLGYTIPATLYHSAVGLSFVDELGGRPRPVWLTEPVGGELANRRLRQRVDWLTGRGFPVSVDWLTEDESWWLHSPDVSPEEDRPLVRRLLATTADWLLAQPAGEPR